VFQRLAIYGKPALVSVEPDFWGFVESQATGRDPTKVTVQVKVESDCAAYANDLTGLAACHIHLARTYAPKARIGFPPSSWGAPTIADDIAFMNKVGLGAGDFTVVQTTDRDVGCYEAGNDSACTRASLTLRERRCDVGSRGRVGANAALRGQRDRERRGAHSPASNVSAGAIWSWCRFHATVNLDQRGVVGVVVGIIGSERLDGNTEVQHLRHRPELAEGPAARSAVGAHLHRAEGLGTLAGEAMTVGLDDATIATVVELEHPLGTDRFTDLGL